MQTIHVLRKRFMDFERYIALRCSEWEGDIVSVVSLCKCRTQRFAMSTHLRIGNWKGSVSMFISITEKCNLNMEGLPLQVPIVSSPRLTFAQDQEFDAFRSVGDTPFAINFGFSHYPQKNILLAANIEVYKIVFFLRFETGTAGPFLFIWTPAPH